MPFPITVWLIRSLLCLGGLLCFFGLGWLLFCLRLGLGSRRLFLTAILRLTGAPPVMLVNFHDHGQNHGTPVHLFKEVMTLDEDMTQNLRKELKELNEKNGEENDNLCHELNRKKP